MLSGDESPLPSCGPAAALLTETTPSRCAMDCERSVASALDLRQTRRFDPTPCHAMQCLSSRLQHMLCRGLKLTWWSMRQKGLRRWHHPPAQGPRPVQQWQVKWPNSGWGLQPNSSFQETTRLCSRASKQYSEQHNSQGLLQESQTSHLPKPCSVQP